MITYYPLNQFLMEYTERNSDNEYRPVAVGRYGIRTRESIFSKELAKDYSKNKLIYKDTLTVGMGSVQIDIGVLSEDVIYSVSPAYHTYRIEGINSEYLKYCLECRNQDMFVRYVKKGSRQGKTIDLKRWLTYEIPVCSEMEQKRVVEKISYVDALIEVAQTQLAKLDDLVKSRFVELFGGRNYPQTPLIQLIVDGAGLSYGIIVPGDNVEDGVPMVRPSDFKNDELCLDNVYKVAPEIEAKYARTRLIGDEILVQVIGQPGQIMLSDSRCKGMNVTRNLAVVRPDGNRINRIYLKIYMQTQEAHAFMLGETKQSTLKQLPLGRLKELEVPVPPMELQNQFATFVEQTDKSKLAVKKSLEKLETLKKTLMQRYFG